MSFTGPFNLSVQPDLFEVTEAPAPAARRVRPPHLPSLEERHAAVLARGALVCRCGHKCESHGSTIRGIPVNLGGGQCGWDDYPALCPCERFEVAS